MATAHRILINADNTGLWKPKQDEETAAKVTELLQDDFEKHHVFFNSSGFHNHITHHLLALYGTGASVSTLQAAYDANASYQKQSTPSRDTVVKELQNDWHSNAPKYLGFGEYYCDFLMFFQLEIDNKGWQAVVNEFLGQDTSRSRDIVQRLFAGITHPLIQLQYGLEWEQPAIIASGLAQAAVHSNPLGDFFDKVDAAVKILHQSGVEVEDWCLSEICEGIRKTRLGLASSATWDDDNPMYEGVLGRGLQEAVELGATLQVKEEDVEERTAEMLHHNAYVAIAASWNPPHIPKFEFFLIHSLNSSLLFFSLKKCSVPASARARLLEHKMRYDLVQYIARGCPPLSMSSIREYVLQDEVQASRPSDLLPRFHEIVDDGHVIKVVRSLLLAQDVSRRWKGRPWIRLDRDEDWVRAHDMLLKGVCDQERIWIRRAGFPNAWKDVPNLC
ncbi:hypothetical protein E4U21_000937 [Claviceps maximensis]|nr:hypothetical protein E4U21_000937 [Claviceps maximensis]